MNTDIRISVELTSHPKTIKLMRSCGDKAFFCLLQLWSWVAKHRPDGCLEGLDTEDIEIAAAWDGEQGKFLTRLIEVRFIDDQDGVLFLHEWVDHNPWAAAFPERSNVNRLKRLAQVDREAFEELKRRGITGLSQQEYDDIKKGKLPDPNTDLANSQLPAGQQPNLAGSRLAPTPTPTPTPLVKKEKELCDAPPESVARSAPVAAPDGAELSRTANSKISKQRKEILFEDFWNVFADKRGREPARKAWLKISGFDEELARQIIAGAECYAEYRRQRQERDPTFIAKMAQGWLTDRRWEDDLAGPAQEQEFSMPPLTAEQIASIKRNTERARRLLLEREANA